jgi:hypothetical protein
MQLPFAILNVVSLTEWVAGWKLVRECVREMRSVDQDADIRRLESGVEQV